MSNGLPAFGSSWRNYDFSGGTLPVDYITQGPPAASTTSSALGGLSGMWPMAVAGLGSGLIQGFFNDKAAGKSRSAAREAAKKVTRIEKDKMRRAERLAQAQLGAQSFEADRDVFRQFGALKYGTDFMAQSPEFARNFRREAMANLANRGASPQYMALAGRFMA
jgi:hypothetical protein